jgi:alpha-D-ribose 1-methylphosphonate 5-triphosphate diphosphatase
MLSSDYVPAALLLAAFRLPALVPGLSLARAVATVTANPARAVGLLDRGELAVGRRADLVRVHLAGEQPVVRETWRGGRRVA